MHSLNPVRRGSGRLVLVWERARIREIRQRLKANDVRAF
jgi:predicted 2-oxoglutarate/Fe(II)-dependent dioxygenase YbiX